MIKQARLKKGLTQGQLAEKVGISRSYISRIEKREEIHEFDVSLEVVHKIANALDLCPLALAMRMFDICQKCDISNPKWTSCPFASNK